MHFLAQNELLYSELQKRGLLVLVGVVSEQLESFDNAINDIAKSCKRLKETSPWLPVCTKPGTGADDTQSRSR